MDKKVFKMYESPAVEIVEVKTEGFLCGSVGGFDDESDGEGSEDAD